MSPVVELKHISWIRPDGQPLLGDISLTFGAERTGLIGRNGVGKTTLLKIMAGELAPTSGSRAVNGTLAVLPQQTGELTDETVAEVFGVAEELDRLARMAAGTAKAGDIEAADWSLEARLETCLASANLEGLDPRRRLRSLSGGQATRVRLAALVFGEPDLLLLDEPTNNLDEAGRAGVADLLAAWKGGAVVASHDRALLRRMDRIVELSGIGARVYGGNWDLYVTLKAEERAAAEHNLAVAKRTLGEVDRDIQAARERQARRDGRGQRSRARRDQPKSTLDKRKETAERSSGKGAELAERKRRQVAEAFKDARREVETLTPLRVDMPSAEIATTKRILEFDGVTWRTPTGAVVLDDLSFAMVGPERVAITGPNGAGKTTLLRLTAGMLVPGAGTVRCFVDSVMLDQHAAILDAGATVLEAFRRINPERNDHDARAILARFLFRNVDALKPVAALSGGERLRAALAAVLGAATPPGLLILDEPTNHLDLDSIAVIENALADYGGALLVVSHDDDFLQAIGVTRRIGLKPQPG